MSNANDLVGLLVQCFGEKENIEKVEKSNDCLSVYFKESDLLNLSLLLGVEEITSLCVEGNKVNLNGTNIQDIYENLLIKLGIEVPKVKKDAKYYAQQFGNFVAPIFGPIIPALVVGGLILAIRNLLVNYFGVSMDSGTSQLMIALFEVGFNFLPIYLGYSTCLQLKLTPVLGMMLGALLICSTYTGGKITDFIGISVPQVSYSSSILPVIFGVIFMYYVDKLLDKVIPKMLKFFLKPLLTMIIVAPVTLIVLGPIGNTLSTYVADGILWLYNTVGIVAIPILCAVYPYMVMLGLDKALSPIGIQLITTVGYNPITAVMGFVSNICIGATTLALASEEKDTSKKGLFNSFAITALCGVTEPAFYGALIERPNLLKGTAIGAVCSGLFAAIFGLRAFVQGGCPGLLTFVFFIDNNGGFHYVIIGILTAVIAIAISFISTKIIIKKEKKI